jgi:hypothetical protein
MRVIGLAVVLAVSLMLAPLVAKAQQMGKVFRVGLISSATPLSETAGPEPANAAARSFVQGLGARLSPRTLMARRSSGTSAPSTSSMRPSPRKISAAGP